MPRSPARRTPWLASTLVLLLPLGFVGLDAFGLFTHATPAAGPQGIWPRYLASDTPLDLFLQLPDSREAPTLELIQGTRRQPLSARHDGQRWQATLPGLAPGTYQLQLSGQPAPLPLTILPVEEPAIRLNQGVYQPGDWLIVSGSARQAGQVRLELVQGERRLQGLNWPLRQGLQQQALHLPPELVPGLASLRVYQDGRLLCARPFTVAAASQASGPLQLIAERSQLLSGQDQPLGLVLLDAGGAPVSQGWIRLLGQTWPVHQGRARVHLTAAQVTSTYEYAAGDSKGNLLQGRLVFSLIQRPWLVQLGDAGKLHFSNQSGRTLNWLLGQGPRTLATGQQTLPAGESDWPLPDLADAHQPAWLSLCDGFGNCQQLGWYPQLPKAAWSVVPPRPDALTPIRIQPPAGLRGQIESFRLLQTGLSPLSPESGTTDIQLIGPPSPPREHPLLLTCWALGALALVMLPLGWYWLQLQALARPFPHPRHRQLSQRGQLLCLGLIGLELLALLLTWSGQFVWAAGAAGLGGLVLAGAQGWLQRRLWTDGPAGTTWMPMLEAALLGLAIWFATTYQPAMLGGFLLAGAGLGLSWIASWQKLIPLSRLQPWRVLALAALGVGTLIHLALQPLLPTITPAWLTAEPLIRTTPTTLLPLTRLLDYRVWPDAGPQILPAARRAGTQQLELRAWNAGLVSSQVLDLEVQPAVLAEFQLPSTVCRGDRFDLPLRFVNETEHTQNIGWRFDQGPEESLSLRPRSEITRTQNVRFERSGWQSAQLEHRYQGRWYSQSQQIYVQAPPPPETDPRLPLRIDLPVTSGLVPGEEIPVLVHFHQSSGRRTAVGLQLGLPAGFTPLVDTLGASAHRKWLQAYQLQPGRLDLQTQVLDSGQEVSFHFRLRAELPGLVHLPASRLFLLDQPQVQTLTPADLNLEVQAD